jgi:hypothetical protein
MHMCFACALVKGVVDGEEDIIALTSVPRARSAATFVVAAVSLLPQWETELRRHAPHLKVRTGSTATSLCMFRQRRNRSAAVVCPAMVCICR